jgi:hypothetical protein
MPRVVPSQVVEFIDGVFPFARSQTRYNVDVQFKDRVMALLRLIEELPSELLTMDGAAYNSFVLGLNYEEHDRT